MKKALIVYSSKTGITEKFGKEIGELLKSEGIDTSVLSVENYSAGMTEDKDIVLLGCWTAGFMLLFQHPDSRWKKFALQLPDLKGKKVALFTTYKIATGSMFKSMRKYIDGRSPEILPELRSRDGKVSGEHKKMIKDFVG